MRNNVKKFIRITKRYCIYNEKNDSYEIRFVVNVPKHEWIADVTCKGYDPKICKVSQINLKWAVMDKNTQHQLHIKYNKFIFKEIEMEVLLEIYNYRYNNGSLIGDA